MPTEALLLLAGLFLIFLEFLLSLGIKALKEITPGQHVALSEKGTSLARKITGLRDSRIQVTGHIRLLSLILEILLAFCFLFPLFILFRSWFAVPGEDSTASIILLILFSIIFAGLLYLVLTFIPARMASAFPVGSAYLSAPFVWLAGKVIFPLAIVVETIGSIACKIFHLPEKLPSSLTEDELKNLVEISSEEGTIEETEGRIVSKVFSLDQRMASSVMTPHSELVWLNYRKPAVELLKEAISSGYSHFPVADGSLEQIIGVIKIHDLASHVVNESGENLKTIITDGLRVPSNISALKVLEHLQRSKADIALVYDEHGTFEGLITLHDLLESLVGSFDAEQDPKCKKRADGTFLVDATIDLIDLQEALDVKELAQEEALGYHSLGGFIFHKLGHIPTEGESLDWLSWRFEVIDMDGMRIDKVLISRIA